MARFRLYVARVRGLFFRKRLERDMEAEINFHLAMQAEDNLLVGMPEEEAHLAALRSFGGTARMKEAYRETGGLPVFETTLQDARYALRTLRKSPAFAAVALMTLTLGIGATTAMFSVVDAVLLHSLPYRDPRRLVSFFEDLGKLGYPRTRVSPTTYLDLKAQTRVFEDVAAVNETGFNLTGNRGGARQLTAALATYNLFEVLGVQPLIGAPFLPEEDRLGANHVVLLSYSVWQNEFGGNPGIIGQTIHLNGEPYAVKGVCRGVFPFRIRNKTRSNSGHLAHSPLRNWTCARRAISSPSADCVPEFLLNRRMPACDCWRVRTSAGTQTKCKV